MTGRFADKEVKCTNAKHNKLAQPYLMRPKTAY